MKYPFFRGAELIEELRLKRMQQQVEKENEIIYKIKQKMDRIKATQQKITELELEPKIHAAGKWNFLQLFLYRQIFNFPHYLR